MKRPPSESPGPESRPPPARAATVREALEAALSASAEPLTTRELSGLVGISEKDVAEHLAHLERSLEARGGRLEVHPASCVACGFTFRERTRLSRPGSCPECRSTRIDPPAFGLTSPSPQGRGPG